MTDQAIKRCEAKTVRHWKQAEIQRLEIVVGSTVIVLQKYESKQGDGMPLDCGLYLITSGLENNVVASHKTRKGCTGI